MLDFTTFTQQKKLCESYEARLKDVAEVKTNFPDADYWITRKGSENSVGSVTREYSPEHIGIKIKRTDLLLPQYHYYMMQHLHNKGHWRHNSTGALNLKNIKTEDVRNLRFGNEGHY